MQASFKKKGAVITPDLSRMDPAAQRFLAMVGLGGSRPSTAIEIAKRRASFERLMGYAQSPTEPTEIEDLTIPVCGGDIGIRVYRPLKTKPIGCLVYFHGGGLVAGGIATHDPLCRMLAARATTTIASIGYRLAPEHPFPTALIDAVRSVRHVLRHMNFLGVDRHVLGVGGDSGGATLATTVARFFRADICLQLLLCPVLDFAGTYESRSRFGDGFLLDAETMRNDLACYAPKRPLGDPWISPGQATDLEALPPAIIHTAGFDPLRDEGAAYATRLAAAGVPVVHTCHETLIHHFYGLTRIIPAADAAVWEIADDLRRGFAAARPHE